MKKLLMPFVVALALLVTISSCKKDECKMCGEYKGKVSGPVNVNLGTAETTFNDTLENQASTATIEETDHKDSVALTVNLTVDGNPINVNVTAYKDSENTFKVTNKIYKFAGIISLLVNGSGTADGTDCTANVKLAEPDGSTDAISGDVTFTTK